MSFKKLSFLYLVFILFLFFSSPGQYVIHYDQMRVTQEELNTRLNSKLSSYEPKSADERSLVETTRESIGFLDSLKEIYLSFADKNLIYGDKLKENQFAEKEVRNGQLSAAFTEVNDRMESVFVKTTGKSLKSDIINLRSFTGQDVKAVEFYFKETPNGVVTSILEHLKTVYLYNVITELFKEKIVLPKYEQISLEDASFIQKFKRMLVLGNSFDLSIKPLNPSDKPVILINGLEITSKPNKNGVYEVSYIPNIAGKYSVDITLGGQRLFAGFEVLKPEFRFIMEESSFDAFVGEKMVISLDTQYLPNRKVKFISDKAEIERDGGKLIVTPYEAGLFNIFMVNGTERLDQISLYAHEPESIEVGLLDISGERSSLKMANRLESLNTFWQVVSFRMSIVNAVGEKQTLRSATRYLRNDLRDAEQKATSGSILVFDDIKLVGRKKGITKTGRPIVLKK